MQGRQFTRRVAKRFFGFIAASVGLSLALVLPGCGDSEPGARAGPSSSFGSDAVRRLLHRPSASVQVSPSTQDQTLTVLGVGVTVPGALLGAPQPLRVSALPDANLGRPMPEMQTVGVYDITLGAASTFDKPLVLEFPYNAAALGDGAAEGKNLWVSYWDTARQQWVRAHATVDAPRQKITVSTDHLSTWWIYRMRGYDYVPKGRTSYFEVYFNPKHLNPRTDVAGQSMQALAEEVLAALETARENYKSAGFKVPSVTTSVFIADVPDSNWGKWGGAIDLKRAEMSTANKIRNDSAHELFHAVQNQYYYTAGMAQRFWFMEGTPDFMAYRYGWKKAMAKQIVPLDLSWFKQSPFENRKDEDAYPFGNFLDYLSTVEAVDIKKLWDDVATWPVNVPQGFRSGVTQQTNKSFDDVWAAFVYESMFGAAALASMPDTRLVVDNSSTEADIQLTLNPGYTARLARIEVKACSDSVKRYFKVGSASEFTGSLAIRLWKATPDGRNPVYLGSLNAASRELANLEVDNSLRVFAIAYNTGASQILAGLQVTASDCQVNSGFSKSYPALELYNRDIIGNLDMSVNGPYTSYQEAVLPGLIFRRQNRFVWFVGRDFRPEMQWMRHSKLFLE
jgi:hypothetical protein